jgi:hypothetical protein
LARKASKMSMHSSWNARSRSTTGSMTSPATAHEKGSPVVWLW